MTANEAAYTQDNPATAAAARSARDSAAYAQQAWEQVDQLRDDLATIAEALVSVGDAIAFSSRDWARNHRDAWVYGILLGWSCEDDHAHDDVCGHDAALTEMAGRHQWDAATVARMHRYRAALARAREITGGA
jgi:hypothetical protein